MRHYSNVMLTQNAIFCSFQSDGCWSGPRNWHDSCFKGSSVLDAVCHALDIGYSDAVNYMTTGDADSSPLTAGEIRVLQELKAFSTLVEEESFDSFLVEIPEGSTTSQDCDSFEKSNWGRKAAFIYTNLNTGRSVVWALSLE